MGRRDGRITPWDRLPEDTRRRLVEEERQRSPKTPLLDGKGFWNDPGVPRERDRRLAEERVRARVDRGEL